MKYILMILMLLIPTLSFAETSILTLDQAIAIAMGKNRDIEKAREYAEYVQGKYVEERAAALPQLSLNGGAVLSKDESQGVSGIAAQRLFGRTVDVTLSQPIYTWGKLNAAIRAAEVGLKTADQQLRLYRQAAHRDVTVAYYNILLAKKLQYLAEENRLQKQRHLDEAKRKFDSGVATDYDVLAAEVAFENSMPEIIRTGNVVLMAREQLRFLLAFGTKDLDVAGNLDESKVDLKLPENYDQAFGIAKKQRPEITDLRLRKDIYDELINIAKSENKPRLDLKGSAGWHWATIYNSGSALDADGAAWNVGVYLTYPFFDGLRTDGKVSQARVELRSKKIEEKKLLDSIALEVRQANFSLLEASKIFTATRGTVKQAERLVQMAEKGYEFGVKIRLEVDDAQLNLVQARSNLAKAERDYLVAEVDYLWAMGVLGE